MARFLLMFFVVGINGLKVWIPNTDAANKLNWDKGDIPRNCDNIRFRGESEVASFWNIKDVAITGLSLPKTGDVIFPENIKIQFRDEEKCPQVRDLSYVRHKVKGWLDPDNWRSDSESRWLPHSERVPCAGEPIFFPPQKTFAIQLPSILVPTGAITFENEEFRGEAWANFLGTELGFQLFKGPDDLRNLPWRDDIGCVDKKKCVCGRSSYTIKDGLYKETSPRIFEEAVCLYAMPKCKPSECYSPIKPDGHCCEICGAVIKIEDNTKEGLNVSSIRTKVEAELEKENYKDELKTYVGRTKEGHVQIVIVAENSGATIKSHIMASLIKNKLIDHKYHSGVSSRVSGLTFSSYLFNSVSGAVFGTLFAVLILFFSIYYLYIILPKKKFGNLGAGNPFLFARFDNTLNEASSEENLEIGVEPETSENTLQAFDNPMYSGKAETSTEFNKPKLNEVNVEQDLRDNENTLEATSSKEYSNPVYTELEKSENLDVFPGHSEVDKDEEFSEIKL